MCSEIICVLKMGDSSYLMEVKHQIFATSSEQ